ncbi:N-6 DNA methylase [Thermomonospora catenispora]|uniref:N-6 DNA methylase n=1 Tax=Thermomonospora catenispora TaxID=2493090 RepID=UPI0019D54F87|nr:N-6 DNA methylase [Thermomonospora catenispora]
MPDTVTAADIARLAGVGRAAVSNWRRRHPDFPRPVGGTATSPQFALHEVEAWLRAQGKLRQVPPAERAWQQIRSRADDTGLGDTLARAGEMLLARTSDPAFTAVAELAAERGPIETYEFLLGRFLEVQPRRVGPTPATVAELMAGLLDPGTASVLDPACGTGTLLVQALRQGSPRRLLGQERDETLARLARIRLALRTSDAEIAAGDSLRVDRFADTTVDAVLCDPPFNERHWGYEELTADVRWEYGLPPRMEPELAWVQHSLAHLEPGGLAVVVMPPAAAGRRSGRRIRAQLLRRGALRAVLALPGSVQLWLLRRPGAESAPSTVLMAEGDDPAQLTAIWRDFHDDPGLHRPGVGRAVPLIELLDEDVDVTPGRHLAVGGTEQTAERFLQTRSRLADTLERMTTLLPAARPAERASDVPVVPLSELARAGALTVRQTPLRREPATADAGVPLLTAQDVIEGREPSARVAAEPTEAGRWILTEAGDVVVTAADRGLAVRVVERGGAALGPSLVLIRVEPDLLDPHYLAGVLRSSANVRRSTAVSSGSRLGIRRAMVPRLPIAEQRRIGALFRRMDELAAALRASADLGGELARLLADGVTAGTLGPDRS